MSNDSSNSLVQVTRALATNEWQGRFKTFLPPDVRQDRFTEVVITALQQEPKLLAADRNSFYMACVSAAKRGLMPDKREGAFTIFPTKQKDDSWLDLVVFLPMVEGIIKELAKVGVVAYACSVYEHDVIEIWNDDIGQHVKHNPVAFGDRGKRIGAYAAGRVTETGMTYIEAMNADDLMKVALTSKQAKKDKQGNKFPGGTWVTWPDRMEQKTVLHRLRKRIPVNGINAADQEDDDAEFVGSSEGGQDGGPDHGQSYTGPAEVTEEPTRSRPRALQRVLEAAQPESENPAPPEKDNDDII